MSTYSLKSKLLDLLVKAYQEDRLSLDKGEERKTYYPGYCLDGVASCSSCGKEAYAMLVHDKANPCNVTAVILHCRHCGKAVVITDRTEANALSGFIFRNKVAKPQEPKAPATAGQTPMYYMCPGPYEEGEEIMLPAIQIVLHISRE